MAAVEWVRTTRASEESLPAQLRESVSPADQSLVGSKCRGRSVEPGSFGRTGEGVEHPAVALRAVAGGVDQHRVGVDQANPGLVGQGVDGSVAAQAESQVPAGSDDVPRSLVVTAVVGDDDAMPIGDRLGRPLRDEVGTPEVDQHDGCG